MTAILDVRSVSKRYGGVTAVKDVSFTVERGQFLGLMGANGAGKTTLFSLIAGNQPVSGGDILLNGRSITGKRPHTICGLGVARTFQIVRPFRDMTVDENVHVAALYKQRTTSAQARKMTDRALEITGLTGLRRSPAGDLTLARQKLVELARALATGGELLLLDEIMAGLTPSEVDAMFDMLGTIRREYALTIICVEHVMRALMRLSERIIVLHHGELVAQGEPDAIAENPEVIRNYFGAV
ncbi:ABC transporter ATP-binding protein [Pusillimonas sp.]|uniref:ABC transporter ATP-binding protein n=1 Tax=Pusillimonas sp. TaxID=3040095 RepID=UPI0029A8860F|nr:ABC transporter ATP-binding protein [Pusillimonas sp.]MDX3896183.1 ABC transporter ATP-binding protein [Pusillimonas sp.]